MHAGVSDSTVILPLVHGNLENQPSITYENVFQSVTLHPPLSKRKGLEEVWHI